MNRICGLLKYFWAESLPPALWPFPPHYSKRGKISLYPPATTVTKGSHTSESIVGASFTATALLYNMAGDEL